MSAGAGGKTTKPQRTSITELTFCSTYAMQQMPHTYSIEILDPWRRTKVKFSFSDVYFLLDAGGQRPITRQRLLAVQRLFAKAEFMQLKLIHLFYFFLMKQLKIKRTKPPFITSVLKVFLISLISLISLIKCLAE